MATQSEGLTWGLIGASLIAGGFMIDAIRNSGSRVQGVYSRSGPWAEEFAAKHGIPNAVDDLERLLADPEIDAVFVSSVNSLHEEQVVLAARAGKNILCEKPLATEVDAARRMIDECRSAGVTFGVNHAMREQTAIKVMRSMIADGVCGRIQFARAMHGVDLPPAMRTWRLHDAGAGAGAALDLTVHDVDTLRFLLDDEVVGVVAESSVEGDAVAETTLAAVLRMGQGCLAVVQDSFDMPVAETVVEVHGTRASLIGTGVLGQRPRGSVALRTAEGLQDVPLPELQEPYSAVVRSFTRAVHDPGSKPSATGADGLASLQAAVAVADAAATGRHVPISGP